MAVPKKRTGKSAQAKRRANWKATVPATTTCKNCGSVVLTHTVCPECGTYKNKIVSIKGQNIAEQETKEEVKETKKAAKKVKETETKVEETKEETAEVSEEKPKRVRKTKKADTENTESEEK